MSRPVSRREFVKLVGAGAVAAAAPTVFAQDVPAGRASGGDDDAVCFFFVSDTHFLARSDAPDQMDERSVTANARLADTLNGLPGTLIPDAAGGGVVGKPRGVIHGGDLIDSGDKSGRQFTAMQRTEWNAFTACFGLDGTDGKVRFPVYEVHGNHDGPGGTGVAIDGIIDRNKRRPGVVDRSKNGLHYSWDWGPFHLANLGIVVGEVKAGARRRRYNPLESLEFLRADLEKHVGRSGRPVILTHHIDLARYTVPCDPDAAFDGKEWDPCDVQSYHRLIRDYNVVAILYGHTHARQVFKWDGQSPRAAEGLDVFNVDESSHFASPNHGLFYFEFAAGRMTVREYSTKDNWQTGIWSKHWTQPISLPKPA